VINAATGPRENAVNAGVGASFIDPMEPITEKHWSRAVPSSSGSTAIKKGRRHILINPVSPWRIEMPENDDRGLAKQIRYMEENIAIKKELGKDYSFEEGLAKEWRKYLPGGTKHHLWIAYSASAAKADDARRGAVVENEGLSRRP